MRALMGVLLVLLAMLTASAQGVATLTDLKNRVGEPGQCIEMRGLASAGDGAGGFYCWDAGSTDAANDRTVIAVTGVAVGRWKTPVQPTGSVALSTTAVTNTAAETTLAATTIKAGMLGSSRSVGFLLICEFTTAAVTSPTLTITVRFGSFALALPATTLTTSASNKVLLIRGRIINQSATSQYTYVESLTFGGAASAASGQSAINTAADVAFSITSTFSSASTSATLNPKVATINLL